MATTVPGRIKVGDHVRWRAGMGLNVVWEVTTASTTMLIIEIDIPAGDGYRHLKRTVARRECTLVAAQLGLDGMGEGERA
jgi:hypothetical protein